MAAAKVWRGNPLSARCGAGEGCLPLSKRCPDFQFPGGGGGDS
jgi:hypothetical protein